MNKRNHTTLLLAVLLSALSSYGASEGRYEKLEWFRSDKEGSRSKLSGSTVDDPNVLMTGALRYESVGLFTDQTKKDAIVVRFSTKLVPEVGAYVQIDVAGIPFRIAVDRLEKESVVTRLYFGVYSPKSKTWSFQPTRLVFVYHDQTGSSMPMPLTIQRRGNGSSYDLFMREIPLATDVKIEGGPARGLSLVVTSSDVGNVTTFMGHKMGSARADLGQDFDAKLSKSQKDKIVADKADLVLAADWARPRHKGKQ
jgi:hypothetical protein